MNDPGTIAIIMACQDHPVMRNLYIGANVLTVACIPSLCTYVQGSTHLEVLDLSYNFIGRGINTLLHAISKSQTIQVLNLAFNAGTESCLGAVKHVLMKPMKTDDDPDPIPSAPNLIELNLEGNQLPPEAGLILKHVLTAPKTKNTNILHINLEHNFLTKHDVSDIEKLLALNRHGAAFKFRYEPHHLQQKWNWNATTKNNQSVKEKKVIPKRTEEDQLISIAKEERRRKNELKNGKGGEPPCSQCSIM
jgi:hypothetical protein